MHMPSASSRRGGWPLQLRRSRVHHRNSGLSVEKIIVALFPYFLVIRRLGQTIPQITVVLTQVRPARNSPQVFVEKEEIHLRRRIHIEILDVVKHLSLGKGWERIIGCGDRSGGRNQPESF